MAIESVCTGCGQKLSVGDEHAGKKARCPACGQVYVVTVNPTFGGSDPSGAAPEPSSGNAFGLSETDYSPTSGSSGSSDMFAGVPESARSDESSPEGNFTGSAAPDQYWMQAADGQTYGPVDRVTLDRWFAEGRVADNYMIRQGETGTYLPSSNFRVAPTASSTNPFASAAAVGAATHGPTVSYPKPDQSGLILAMGIMSFLVCGICGIIAWVMGNTALKDIQAGRADPTNKGLVQVGYYLGMTSVLLHLLCGAGYIVFFAIMIMSA
ncbi:MAG: hypothetical protein Aurels2KO_51140 [Aureliella sp.]